MSDFCVYEQLQFLMLCKNQSLNVILPFFRTEKILCCLCEILWDCLMNNCYCLSISQSLCKRCCFNASLNKTILNYVFYITDPLYILLQTQFCLHLWSRSLYIHKNIQVCYFQNSFADNICKNNTYWCKFVRSKFYWLGNATFFSVSGVIIHIFET